MNPFATALDRLIALFAPADFTIRWRPGRPVAIRGRVAKSKVVGIVRFFSSDLNLPGPVTVLGTWGRATGPPRLRISGAIGPADRQRVRNFLVEQLR